jgi:hypothetical protein
MLVVYLSALLLLGVVQFLLRRRVARLERAYVRAATMADAVLRKVGYKDGNGGRPDPLQAAKRQYQLARLAEKRDAVEARYASWQHRADRLAALRGRLFGWKGRLLPYFFGVIDVAVVLAAVEMFGAGEPVSARALAENARALLGR